ncbi:MAG: 50S ribosomal protein L5 [Phycisphaera sp.]|nr:50S ribosomal protein L5 [Phycisphaera sp.]
MAKKQEQEKSTEKAPVGPKTPPRMKVRFNQEVSAKVKEQFKVANPMALPRLEKVILNVGLGKQLEGTKLNPKAKEQVIKDLTVIAGQKPVMCIAKKSVSNFKLRAGFEIGARVTLRGDRMWEFVDRLISLAIPRIKDFRGLPFKSFDKAGNYAFGVQEQGIFPEVDMANAEFQHGLNVQFCFKNSSPEVSKFVLAEMGVPFVKPEDLKQGRRR